MNMEQLVERKFSGKTEALGENLPQCHFSRHKSHIICPGIESGPLASTQPEVVSLETLVKDENCLL
jgi:hypothetical protein